MYSLLLSFAVESDSPRIWAVWQEKKKEVEEEEVPDWKFENLELNGITRKSTHRCASLTCITCLTCIICITCITYTTCIIWTWVTCITYIPCITCTTHITCTTALLAFLAFLALLVLPLIILFTENLKKVWVNHCWLTDNLKCNAHLKSETGNFKVVEEM